MKYELKDRTFHMQLDSLSEGDFSKQLNAKMLEGAANDPFTVRFGKLVGSNLKRFEIAFQLEEILIHEEYNANQWNSYPKVIPPNNVPLRLEIRKSSNYHEVVLRRCAYYSGGYWCNEEGRLYNIGDKDDVQFTSWE